MGKLILTTKKIVLHLCFSFFLLFLLVKCWYKINIFPIIFSCSIYIKHQENINQTMQQDNLWDL